MERQWRGGGRRGARAAAGAGGGAFRGIAVQVKGEPRAFQTGRATAAHVDARRRGAELRTGNPAHASGRRGTPVSTATRTGGNETKLRGGRSGEKRGFWPVRGVTLTTWWKSEIAVWLVALDWESGILG